MPQKGFCPNCAASVTVPDGTARTAFLRCPNCNQTFKPSSLTAAPAVAEEKELEPAGPLRLAAAPAASERPKPLFDGEAELRRQKRQKRQKRRERQEAEAAERKPRRGLFEGVEGFFLVITLILCVSAPAVYFAVNSLEFSGTGVVVLAAGAVLFLAVYVGLVQRFRTGPGGFLGAIFGRR